MYYILVGRQNYSLSKRTTLTVVGRTMDVDVLDNWEDASPSIVCASEYMINKIKADGFETENMDKEKKKAVKELFYNSPFRFESFSYCVIDEDKLDSVYASSIACLD